MNWIKENWFRLIIAAAILIATGSIAYYFVIVRPAIDKAHLEQEAQLSPSEQLAEKELEALRQFGF